MKTLSDIQYDERDHMASLTKLIGEDIHDIAGSFQNVVGVGPTFVIHRINFEDGSWLNVDDGCAVNSSKHPQPNYSNEQVAALVREWYGDDDDD